MKASTSHNHGWKTKWHSEYNGFICLVHFISEEPNKLPWNTAKNGMREDSMLFLTVIDEIQPIADQYRSDINKHRYSPNPKASATPTLQPPTHPAAPYPIHPIMQVITIQVQILIPMAQKRVSRLLSQIMEQCR